MKGHDNLKSHVKDNCSSLTNYYLAVSGLRFNLPAEYDKPDDIIISATKMLMQKVFSGLGR